MLISRAVGFTLVLLGGLAVVWFPRTDVTAEKAGEATGQRLFELRTYTAAPGKLEALHARFRDHTQALFKKHGMEVVGFWTPADGEEARNTLVYLLAYPDLEAREKAWKAFREDPEWKKAREESERDGRLVEKVVEQYLKPTDYSPLH